MGKSGKSSDGSEQIREMLDKSNAMIEKGKNEGYGFLDTGRSQALENINPLIPQASQIMQGSMGNVANFDKYAQAKVNQAQQAYAAPAERNISEQLKNLYAKAGVGGNNNSRQLNMMSRLGNELATNEATRRYELENQVRNNTLGEQQNLYNFGSNPVMYKSQLDSDVGKSKANTAVGSASQAAQNFSNAGNSLSQAAQFSSKQKQDAKAGQMQLAGSMVGAGAGAASAFSDMRLKEDVHLVGKLKNGYNVYSYRFKDSPVYQIGLSAQEVALTRPNAVHKDKKTGYLKVNYKEAVA